MLRNFVLRMLLFPLLGVMSYNVSGQSLQNNVNIQIISSFSYENEWGQMLAKSLKKEIEKSVEGGKTDIFYSGADKANSLAQAQEMLHPALWRNNTPSAIVVIGYEAWMGLKSLNDSTLKNTPIILCGIEEKACNNYESYLINNNILPSMIVITDSLLNGYNAAAVTMKDNSVQTLSLILSLMPGLKNILYLSEQTYSDYLYIKRLNSLITSTYPAIRFSVIKTQTVEKNYLISIEEKIDKPGTAILLNNYNTLENPHQSGIRTSKYAVPLFTIKQKQLGNTQSIVGGTFEPVKEYAGRVTQTIQQMLAGADTPSIYTEGDCITILNQKAVIRYKMDTAKLPQAVFVNPPDSKTVKYMIAAAGIIAVPLLMIVILLLIIRSFHKKRQIQKAMLQYSDILIKYNAIFKNASIGMAMFDKEGISSGDTNSEFMKMIKIIIPNVTLSEKFNLHQSELVTEEIKGVIDQGEKAERDITIENENSKSSYKVSFIPLHYKKEKNTLVSIVDTTQPVREKLKRDSHNAIFNKAITESRLGIAELDLISGTCIATEGWYKGLGIPKVTSIEKCFANLVKEDRENLYRFIEKAICNNAIKTAEEVRVMNSDSTYHWIKIIVKIKECSVEKKSIICSAILVDIDARKQKEEQLKEAYMKIIKAIRVKNSFIANMSHELKTPLNAIVGFAELIIESSETEEQKELLKYLEDNNEKLLKLVTDIVDMSKIESGTVKCTMSEIDLNEMMNELVKNARVHHHNREVEVVFNPKENGIVYSDKERLQQIMGIFLSNSMKYTKKGSIELGYKLLDNKVQLFVTDTGCGIEPEKRDKLFNRFAKPDKEYMGFGLGLPIAHSITKLLEGEIGFTTTLGKGSTFWSSIPSQYIGTDTQIGLTGKLENATTRGENLKTLLIAEDNENNFQLLNFILKGKFKIIHAINGEKAVELYKTHHPDIILMDIKMPVMDGYEATAAIRELSKDIPIIAVTAYAFSKDKERILDSSFSAFIAKPVREKELMDTITTILNK